MHLVLDCWSWWNCKLVTNPCWLVWEKMAPKILQGWGCYLWAFEEYHGIVLLTLNFRIVHIHSSWLAAGNLSRFFFISSLSRNRNTSLGLISLDKSYILLGNSCAFLDLSRSACDSGLKENSIFLFASVSSVTLWSIFLLGELKETSNWGTSY